MRKYIETLNAPSDLYSGVNARQIGALTELGEATVSGEAIKNIIEKANTEKLSEETGDDEVFTTEDEESKKILGMPRGVAIGVGVLVLAVGGFFVYKKFIAKKSS